MNKRITKKKFRRTRRDTSAEDFQDERGTVRVWVRLVDPSNGRVIKGNVNRSLTLADAKVFEVADAIEKALVE